MGKKDVTIYPANDVAGDGAVEPYGVTGVDDISFIDGESHGAGRTFGITDNFKGRKLIISSPNVVAVQVDAD